MKEKIALEAGPGVDCGQHMIRSVGRKGLVQTGLSLSALAMVVCAAQWTPAAPAPAGHAQVMSRVSVGSDATGPATRTTHTAVHIAVPPVAVILVDSSGSPVAVETNTNRSPRRGDLWLTTDSPRSEDLRRATQAQADRVLRTLGSTAVWQPGWHYIGRG